MTDAKLTDEAGRLAALDRYHILGTPAEANFDKITALVQLVLDVPISAVSLIAADRQWFKSMQGAIIDETPRDVAFCSHTIMLREPLVIPDATLDPRFAGNPYVTGAPGIRSYAGMPLSSPDGYNLGALCAIDTRPREFTAAHLDILRNFASLVVDEFELRLIARKDFLTGALTRRAFVEAASKDMMRLEASDLPSSLVMFDLDHFKQVNDRFGHPVGDQVLKIMSSCVGRILRPGDAFGRLGGEEFGILLPATDVAAAVELAEVLRSQIADLAFVAAPRLKVTASFGIAPLRPHPTLERWMAAADAALYSAKRSGRDRIVIGSPDDGESEAA